MGCRPFTPKGAGVGESAYRPIPIHPLPPEDGFHRNENSKNGDRDCVSEIRLWWR